LQKNLGVVTSIYLHYLQVNTLKNERNASNSSLPVYLQILETPSLLAEGSSGGKKNIFKQKAQSSDASSGGCCS